MRAGLIVGPYDPTGRFTYWPHRIARGGDVLVPGPAWRPVQIVDVRDLAAWIVRSAEERHTGPFNATGPTTMGAVVDAAQAGHRLDVPRRRGRRRVPRRQEVGEWMELPLWVDTRNEEWRHFLEVDTSRAVAAGMTFRPLDETVAATLEHAELVDGVGLTPEREAELLAAWWGRGLGLGPGGCEPGGHDRVERQPLVDLAGEAAHADGADPHAVREQRDAPEEEREERVEARELGRPVGDLLGESARRRGVAPRRGVGLAPGVELGVERSAVHPQRGDDLAVIVGDDDRDGARRLGDDPVDDRQGEVVREASGCHRARLYHARVPTFDRTTLSNGTRVLTAPMSHAQSVSCFVMFAAGSRYERREESGIAHFAEHMFFKGTERRPTARDIATEIDGIGGEFNAFTGKELTGYYVKCAAETRDVALDVLVDMLRNSRFDSDEIDREKGVIVEEMNMYADTPRSYIGNVWERHLYGDQPLGWDIIGTEETVRGATRDTFLGYLDRWYRPERTVVGLGGRIGDDVLERLEGLLGDIDARETGAADAAVLPTNGDPVRIHTKQSDQAHVVVGTRSYPHGHPDRYVLQLLSTVLGGGMSSRLFTEVRERRGLAYYVFCGNTSYADAGTLAAQAGVDLSRIDESIETIAAELRRIVAEPVPAEELEKARSYAKGRFVLGLESPHATIMFGLRRELLEGVQSSPRRSSPASTR